MRSSLTLPTKPIPLRLLFGWKGAGKSMLAKALLSSRPNMAMALDDGRVDLVALLNSVAIETSASEIIVETSSVMEPMAVAELFGSASDSIFDDEGAAPNEEFEIKSIITIVDATSFFSDLDEAKELEEIGMQYDELDDRTVADVIIEQIEFSDIVVLNHFDELEADAKVKVRSAIDWLNPRAQVVEIGLGGVSEQTIESLWRACDETSFDVGEAERGAGWVQLLEGVHPKLDRGTGIGGFVLRGRRPLHPERFNDFLSGLSASGQADSKILRVKGWIWIATRHNEAGLWCLAGSSSLLISAGAWMAATPMGEWPDDPREREAIMRDWVAPFGDRAQELAVIGFELDEFELRKHFKKCLLTDEEMALGPDVWANWHDPLPDWSVDGEDIEDIEEGPGYLQ